MNLSATHSSKYHVQGHRNIKVKCIIIAYIGSKKHNDQNKVILYAYVWFDSATFGREQESLDGYEKKL